MSELTQATQALTSATQQMQSAKESFESIRQDATQSINAVNANFAEKAASLTITANLGYRNAVEKASGGRNTMILDAQGNENIMVVIPRFNCEDINAAVLAATGVDMQLGVGTHPAFRTNGVDRGEILVGKYLASAGAGSGCSVIGGVQPRTSVNYDTAKSLSANKGDDWHMMSIHEWAAIALWSLANGTVPRGNTNYGRAHDAKWEVSQVMGALLGDISGNARNGTGSGPDTWSHDHGAFGVQDLVGNVWEWQDQMLLDNGQIITTLDNDPSLSEANWYRHAGYLDSPTSNQSGSGNAGTPVLSSVITNRNGPSGSDSHDYPYIGNGLFSSISTSESYSGSEVLRRLLIESVGDAGLTGYVYARNYGKRFPRRGGCWTNGVNAGLGAIDLGLARSIVSSSIGFRPALFV
ncbi:SUMF1/EgtB/PvdO family nonheme iron enzyme [Marinomonas sp. BSi20584]|uniref:SUMF1/EgtB/PvdO family nonheme iron enzyme n=1 Tax=Marinomonas sp. BSi20584 TaxID=1594462 RepID=UPI0012FE497A|nr:SUMF1/EgtB/PvdO family nonheme iron enzyme [Marinomonas sp. BSi20584]